jgi:phosphocarrier protein HPr
MQQQTVIVKWRAGLHARPASEIVKLANQYSSEIMFKKGDMEVNAKSIIGIMTLGATYKSSIHIMIDGEDEEQALKDIVLFFENKVNE